MPLFVSSPPLPQVPRAIVLGPMPALNPARRLMSVSASKVDAIRRIRVRETGFASRVGVGPNNSDKRNNSQTSASCLASAFQPAEAAFIFASVAFLTDMSVSGQMQEEHTERKIGANRRLWFSERKGGW